ncbi:MAG TPA: hypothetical protein VGC96_05010, partial [Candidatus Elarobacter sp.]
MRLRLLPLLVTLLALIGFASATPAEARGYGHDRIQVFNDVSVGPGETIDGDVDVIFGDATIAGTVHGDCITVFGTCTVLDGGHVDGQINGG